MYITKLFDRENFHFTLFMWIKLDDEAREIIELYKMNHTNEECYAEDGIIRFILGLDLKILCLMTTEKQTLIKLDIWGRNF